MKTNLMHLRHAAILSAKAGPLHFISKAVDPMHMWLVGII
jgi:hypothetical protein